MSPTTHPESRIHATPATAYASAVRDDFVEGRSESLAQFPGEHVRDHAEAIVGERRHGGVGA